MALKAYDVYHGGDWLTYRASVAQCHDTFDRLRDILQPLADDGDLGPEMTGATGFILDLCDDLAGELDIAIADLQPGLQTHLANRWIVVELRAHMTQLRRLAGIIAEDPPHPPAQQADELVETMRQLLRQIDA